MRLQVRSALDNTSMHYFHPPLLQSVPFTAGALEVFKDCVRAPVSFTLHLYGNLPAAANTSQALSA